MHVLIDFERQIKLIGLTAAVKQTVVQNLICFYFVVLHRVQKLQCTFDVLLSAKTLNHGAVSDKIRSYNSVSVEHLVENLGSFIHSEAFNAYVDDRVVCDSVWSNCRIDHHFFKHLLVETDCLVQHPLFAVSFDHRCENHCVHWHSVSAHALKHILGTLKITVFDTGVK